jgi:hypothetical protein
MVANWCGHREQVATGLIDERFSGVQAQSLDERIGGQAVLGQLIGARRVSTQSIGRQSLVHGRQRPAIVRHPWRLVDRDVFQP